MYSRVIIKGIEPFNGENCYIVETVVPQNTENNKTESYIYVSTTSFLPIRQYVKFEHIIGKAKEIQTFDYWTSDFKSGSVTKNQFSREIKVNAIDPAIPQPILTIIVDLV